MVLAWWLENDFHQRETKYQRQIQEHQNTILELQHDVHRLNNIINPIPPPVATEEEEEDPEMFMEDDGWEEEEEEQLVQICTSIHGYRREKDRKLQERPWHQVDENHGQL